MELASVRLTARNSATASENRIHADDVARRFGFGGGLVPGVTLFAYMTRPLVAAYGRAWLERGTMTARFLAPVYDGEPITIGPSAAEPEDGSAVIDVTLTNGAEVVCAAGTATLRPPTERRPHPDAFAWPIAPWPDRERRPPAGEDTLAPGAALGTLSMNYHAERASVYLDEIDETLPVYRRDGLAHPGWLLTTANTVLAGSVRLGPWIHVSSSVEMFGVVADGDRVTTRAVVAKRFDRKGHRFVELDVLVMAGDRPVMRADHTAIYELRPPAGA